MIFSAKPLKLAMCLSWLPLFSGCASYYSHYAVFPAENSAGEPRQVRLSWQTAEYPAWRLKADQATPIKIETQCSQKFWLLFDHTHPEFQSQGQCGEGIRACGSTSEQVAASAGPVNSRTRCLAITNSEGAVRITELGSRFQLSVYCEPIAPVIGKGDTQESHDYLRASVVPYTVQARKVVRGSLDSRSPALDATVCEGE